MTNMQGMPWFLFRVSDEQTKRQREMYSQQASLVHWTSMAPILAVAVLRLLRLILRSRNKEDLDSDTTRSRSLHAPREGLSTLIYNAVAERWHMLCWWMEDDICWLGDCVTSRGECIAGAVWFAWMILLCIVGKSDGMCVSSRAVPLLWADI